MSDVNFELRHKILDFDPKFAKCFQCGVCTSSCVAVKCLGSEKYSPRKTVLFGLCGSDTAYTNPSMWSCAMCHRCQERCPEDAHPAELFAMLKGMAYKKGVAPERVYQLVRAIIDTGSGFPVTPATNSIRKRLGLPEFAQPDTSDLKIIAEKTGLFDIERVLDGKNDEEKESKGEA